MIDERHFFKVLCLASGERISFGPGMKLIFEVDHLANASPATVSRFAVVYVVSLFMNVLVLSNNTDIIQENCRKKQKKLFI